MLAPQHFIERGYKRRELGDYSKFTLADYLFQKLINSVDGYVVSNKGDLNDISS